MHTDNKDKEDQKTQSMKDIHFLEFNEKLEDSMPNIQSKSPSKKRSNLEEINNNKKALNNSSVIHSNTIKEINNPLLNKCLENKNQKNLSENELKKANTRLDITKMITSDQFAENFILVPSNNNQNNINYDLPYLNTFEDRMLLVDESIFFIFNEKYNNKFLTKEDIKKIKKDDYNINFGKDPYDTYQQIFNGDISPDHRSSIELYNSLNYFSIFKCKDPFFLNIKMENANNENGEDCFNMINGQEQRYGNNIQNIIPFLTNENECILNERCFKEEKKENENDDNIDNNFIGKKRNNKEK